MTVYHIVLFKLKPGTPQEKVEELKAAGSAMVGQVPGLQRIDFGPPVLATRAHGFDIGLVAILDKKEDIKVYAEHPAHLKVHALREAVCDDTLAYDLEF
ncbi:hypothetical protein CLAFUW4_03119 [Fulvia fulva]|uniref:Stress-response A/B barrel domain-containing protein n=1 Tax=Passalora fulva TaxID=5499 RepID=A0A9Q8LA34_PASFU|nr:uncharacterized protein CLAFUR5_03103 [Fulvia fulva]KAK4630970.1 hypothetical protein CLAFUR4_03111 [Fulvia fulva]KAK4633964.1 hypothetical protein CLAFUR0_03115 [Fulvia fulva]UJO13716.1 hypothetical protein CLAFUR5_03103 [Fulvia fulva]WPV10796.1 hypothetical protein CLAFUW4_03119 [Fulvia fulva]WPV25993.1 hypothetical protein CLAFUW7_03115 [Fulvia fulva]